MIHSIAPSRLSKLIMIWNKEHIDMFKITTSSENHMFSGIIKIFYFDEKGEILSRCLAVDSTSCCDTILKRFIEKSILPYTIDDLSLFAVFPSGEHNIICTDEIPLVIQLLWSDQYIEGRFMVKVKHKKPIIQRSSIHDKKIVNTIVSTTVYLTVQDDMENCVKILYDKVPSACITSGVICQEDVLKRQRQAKLGKKIKEYLEYESQHGLKFNDAVDGDACKLGTLKIFVNSILPEIPYKTIMVAAYDNARSVILEILEKLYQSDIDKDPNNYFLTMLTMYRSDNKSGKRIKKGQQEYRILDDDLPLMLQAKFISEHRNVTFHIRKRVITNVSDNPHINETARKYMIGKRYFAILCELIVTNNTNPKDHPAYIALNRDVVAIGSNTFSLKETNVMGQKASQMIVIKHHSIHPLHCVISGLNGVLTITPAIMEADVRVDGLSIYETTTLLNGSHISIGCAYFFQVFIPSKVSAETSQIYWKTLKHAVPMKTISSLSSPVKKNTYQSCQPTLPINLKFKKEDFESILQKLLNLLFDTNIQFKLTVSYLVYLCFITQFDNCFNFEGVSAEKNTLILKEFRGFCKICSRILDESIIYKQQNLETLICWLGNISEFLNFVKHDLYLCSVTEEVQRFCEHCIRTTVNEIIRSLESDTGIFLDAFFNSLDDSIDISDQLENIINYDPSIKIKDLTNRLYENHKNTNIKLNYFQKFLSEERSADFVDILHLFNEFLSIFCRYQINPSFTAQIFQRVFYHMSKHLLDSIIFKIDHALFNQSLFQTIEMRLKFLNFWAESQGLEVFLNKCLQPFVKTIQFLQTRYTNAKELIAATAKCDCLNAKQLYSILIRFKDNICFSSLSKDDISCVVQYSKNAKTTSDEINHNNKLEFSFPPTRPCFITQDGYTSENQLDVADLLFQVIQEMGLNNIEVIRCNDNQILWNCRFDENFDPLQLADKTAEYMFLSIHKQSADPLGMRIIHINNSSTGYHGIFICNIEPGSIIHRDGRLSIGDQLISVNGISLAGKKQIEAVNIIRASGNVIRFEVLKNSAKLHGIQRLIRNPIEHPNKTDKLPSPTRIETNSSLATKINTLRLNDGDDKSFQVIPLKKATSSIVQKEISNENNFRCMIPIESIKTSIPPTEILDYASRNVLHFPNSTTRETQPKTTVSQY